MQKTKIKKSVLEKSIRKIIAGKRRSRTSIKNEQKEINKK